MAPRRKFDPEEMDPDELEEKLEELGENEDAILRDGQSLRVPLDLRDGSTNPDLTPTQRGKAMYQTEDAVARRFGLSDALQLHRPGFRRVTDAAALERAQVAYAAYDAADANAWRGNSSVKPPAPRTEEPRLTTDARAEAYRLYDEEQSNAWRSRK